jgi:hypothetical protein
LHDALSEGFQDRMMSNRGSCGHEQAGAYLLAACKDLPPPALFAAS